MRSACVDNGNEFDFGRVSDDYARFRDVYPKSMYDKLIGFGIGAAGQRILDVGSGTAVLPLNMYKTGAEFFSTDISENQVLHGRRQAEENGIVNVSFKVCSAEDTGFADGFFDVVTAVQCFHYFYADAAAEEFRRVLKPGGVFCKVFMDWLPFEDELVAATERLVLKHNPDWNGNGFKVYEYSFPEWASGRFVIDTIHSYDAVIEFSKESWIGRMRSCRGVGASLSPGAVAAFEADLRELLRDYRDPLLINLKRIELAAVWRAAFSHRLCAHF